MWPFKRKFTEEQRTEIDSQANTLNKLAVISDREYDQFIETVSDLYYACGNLLKENPRSGVDQLYGIEPVDAMSVIPSADLLVSQARVGMKW